MVAEEYCCYHYPHFNRGRIFMMQGEVAEAVRSFELALRHEPDYAPALRALEYIRGQGLQPI